MTTGPATTRMQAVARQVLRASRLMQSRLRTQPASPASQKQQLQVKSRCLKQMVMHVVVDFSLNSPIVGPAGGEGAGWRGGLLCKQEDRSSHLRRPTRRPGTGHRSGSTSPASESSGGGDRASERREFAAGPGPGPGPSPRPRTGDTGQSRAPRMGGTPPRAGPWGPPEAAEARRPVAPPRSTPSPLTF